MRSFAWLFPPADAPQAITRALSTCRLRLLNAVKLLYAGRNIRGMTYMSTLPV